MPTEQVKKHLSLGGQEFIHGQVFFFHQKFYGFKILGKLKNFKHFE